MPRRSQPRRSQPRKQVPRPTGAPRVGKFPDTLLMLPPEAEFARLWRHVLFGTESCISMIEGYTGLHMPGIEMAELYRLRDRLNTVISKQEQTNGRN